MQYIGCKTFLEHVHKEIKMAGLVAPVVNGVCACHVCKQMVALVFNYQTKAHDPYRFDRKDLDEITCSICHWIAADAVQVFVFFQFFYFFCLKACWLSHCFPL